MDLQAEDHLERGNPQWCLFERRRSDDYGKYHGSDTLLIKIAKTEENRDFDSVTSLRLKICEAPYLN